MKTPTKMTRAEALKILSTHQKWRLGGDPDRCLLDDTGRIRTSLITAAIDVAIRCLRQSITKGANRE